MKLTRLEYRDSVAVLKLDRGITNPINLELLKEIGSTLRMLRYEARLKAVVLTSANDKFFSIGFDIPHLIELNEQDLLTFCRTFDRTCMDLYSFPKPTVAAITGHAVAGGCILTLCCDYRYIAEGHKLMGLNEIKLGVTIPYPGDCILRQLVGFGRARDLVDGGEFYEPPETRAMGLVDDVLPSDQLLDQTIARAAALGAKPAAAFALIKRDRVEGVEAQINKRLAAKEKAFVELWYSEEAHERLREAAKKF
jgi:enoyl-CoA hydratase/carnithine racemase